MDDEPVPNPSETDYRLKVFDSGPFADAVSSIEKALDARSMTDEQEELEVERRTNDLLERFCAELEGQLVDVIGCAYVGDNDGEFTLDTDLIYRNDIMFDGFDIVKPYGQDHKVVFRYIGEADGEQSDGSEPLIETFFIPLEEIVKFMPSYEVPCDSEQLCMVLSAHANRSEEAVGSPAFTGADGATQRKMLKDIAHSTAFDVMATYGEDIVAVGADEYYIVTLREGVPVIAHVDQLGIPFAERSTPIGKVEDCSFIELLQTGPDEKIKKLSKEYPSIVLNNEKGGVLVYVPIRAFKYATVFDEQALND